MGIWMGKIKDDCWNNVLGGFVCFVWDASGWMSVLIGLLQQCSHVKQLCLIHAWWLALVCRN